MRHRIIFATLLAGSAFSPALSQEVEATVAAEAPVQVEQVVAAQPVLMAAAEQEGRRERGDGGWGRRAAGSEGMRAMPEAVERAPRADWQQRQQAQPVPQPQVQAQTQRDWSGGQRGGGNDGGGGWRREAPVVMSAPQAPVDGNRGWRGGNDGGGWQRREAPATTMPVAPPVQNRIEGNRDWRGGNAGDWNRGNDRLQPQGDWNRRDDNRGNEGGWNRPGANPGWQNRDAGRRWDNDRRGDNDRHWDNNQRWNDRNWNNNRNWNNQGWNNNQRWNRDWRQDRRYDWERYRYSNRNLYRMPRYYSPYGYNYNYERFGIGIYLESLFYGSRYRISDPWRYRLPDANWPYEWVRYYDDVLLVDTRNGYVVDVIYDFFW